MALDDQHQKPAKRPNTDMTVGCKMPPCYKPDFLDKGLALLFLLLTWHLLIRTEVKTKSVEGQLCLRFRYTVVSFRLRLPSSSLSLSGSLGSLTSTGSTTACPRLILSHFSNCFISAISCLFVRLFVCCLFVFPPCQ